jgi:hypothetical protein
MLHLARQFQRRLFRYRPIRNKNCLWWPCLLTDRDKMCNPHRGHSIDASCHVSVNLAKRWPPQAILVSYWSISKKSSPLKLPSQVNRNLVGSIYMYERLCMKLRNGGKGEASPSLFPRFAPNTPIYLYASTVHMYCIYPVF